MTLNLENGMLIKFIEIVEKPQHKKNMFSCIRYILYKGSSRNSILYDDISITKRHMLTWQGMYRKTMPQKPQYEPKIKKWDDATGYEIMHPVDYSGANHSFLGDTDFKHPIYYKIYGVFTSSSKKIDNILPELIDNHLFTGKSTPQFFLRYPKPKLIEKEFVAFDALVDLNAPHIKEYLASLEITKIC